MAPGRHQAPAGTTRHSEPAPRAVTDERRVALFASGLQRSDAPSTAMAAEAIMATVRRIGIHACVSRMAQGFGDHRGAATGPRPGAPPRRE